MLASVDWPAVLAAGGGVVVALVTLALNFLDRRGQRRHEAELAREGRVYGDVQFAYNQALVAAFELERTAGRVGRGEAEPPEGGPELNPATVAGVLTFGKQPVVDALERVTESASALYAAARAGEREELGRRHEDVRGAVRVFADEIRRELRGARG